MSTPNLPQWQCHKVVQAAQIVAINDVRVGNLQGDGVARLHLAGDLSVTVDASWCKRHEARVGGYYVVYEDGYASYSPQAAFEGGYTPIPQGATA